MKTNQHLAAWVEECARLTRPDRIFWCDGSEGESQALLRDMVRGGVLLELDPSRYPRSFLHRTKPTDVARSEELTYICTREKAGAGALNNWMAPDEGKERLAAIYAGAMAGRTLYVVPYLMGPPGSSLCRAGVELTDSPYVVASMRIMTRMGRAALEHIGDSNDFVRGLHSLADLDPARRFICHFPEEKLIWSVGSGYGGNALLGKKCFALRIASGLARDEGWLAEHMLIAGVEDPEGRVTYIAAAFPSACGKTNLAMLQPPRRFAGWKVWTVGDDIAWLRVDSGGGLSAINPEAGFFGVAPGTSAATNPVAMDAIHADTIFTNVGLAPGGLPWWEGIDGAPPAGLVDWQGRPWMQGAGSPAAHPNARFTTPARRCSTLSRRWEDPEGVPISAIIFGGRRSRLDPLVYEARDWRHGVYVGATMGSETTAAATGDVGKLRRDPMAMRPFCGYDIGDYFAHWLEVGGRLGRAPRIFHVNWFRKGADGKYLWPGFGENLRVIQWILARVRGEVGAREARIGLVPHLGDIDLSGLSLSPKDLESLLESPRDERAADHADEAQFLSGLGPRVPAALWEEHRAAARRFGV